MALSMTDTVTSNIRNVISFPNYETMSATAV